MFLMHPVKVVIDTWITELTWVVNTIACGSWYTREVGAMKQAGQQLECK